MKQMNMCWCFVQHTPLQRADDYKLFNFDFVAHILNDSVTLQVVLKMFYGLNVVENFQVPVEVGPVKKSRRGRKLQ